MFHLNLPFASGVSCQGAEVSRALDVVSVGMLCWILLGRVGFMKRCGISPRKDGGFNGIKWDLVKVLVGF